MSLILSKDGKELTELPPFLGALQEDDLLFVRKFSDNKDYSKKAGELIEAIGASFQGLASPSDPSPATQNGWWLAAEQGTYTNYGGFVLSDPIGIIGRIGGVFQGRGVGIDLSEYAEKSELVTLQSKTQLSTGWKCREYNLNRGGFVTNRIMSSGGIISTATGGITENIPVWPLVGKVLYIEGWLPSNFAGGQTAAFGRGAFYNSGGVVVSTINSTSLGYPITVPETAHYLVLMIAGNIMPTQEDANRFKISCSFNRINEEGREVMLDDIRHISLTKPLSEKYLLNPQEKSYGWKSASQYASAGFATTHPATPVIRLVEGKLHWWYNAIGNNYTTFGFVFLDENYGAILHENKTMVTLLNESNHSFSVDGRTVYGIPIAPPMRAKFIVLTYRTNGGHVEAVNMPYSTVSTEMLTASDFPNPFPYDIVKYNSVAEYKEMLSKAKEGDRLNIFDEGFLTNGTRFNAAGTTISGGGNFRFPVIPGEVYHFATRTLATAIGDFSVGVYKDSNGDEFPITPTNKSMGVISSNGDGYSNIRVTHIIAGNDWVEVAFNTTTSTANQQFQVGRGFYTGFHLPNQIRPVRQVGRFEKKKASFLGDSITWQLRWQIPLYLATGLATDYFEIRAGKNGHRATAEGGIRIWPGLNGSGVVPGSGGANTSIFGRAEDVKFYDPEIIIIMGGRNDLGKNVIIGSASDPALTNYEAPPLVTGIAYATNETDTTGAMKTSLSFASSYRGMLLRLMQDNPNSRIVCLTPIGGNDGARAVKELQAVNAVIKGICFDYGIQVIDLYNKSGINRYTYANLASDGIHPNTNGGQRIADIMASEI